MKGGPGGRWSASSGGGGSASRQGAWRDWGGGGRRDSARPAMSADLVEYVTRFRRCIFVTFWPGTTRSVSPRNSANVLQFAASYLTPHPLQIRRSLPSPDASFWGAKSRGTEFSFKDADAGSDADTAESSRQNFSYPWAELPKDAEQGVNTWDFRFPRFF